MTVRPLLGPSGRIPILIRDDDINFFTKSEMLEQIYSKAWSDGFKIGLSTIPLQKGISDVCVPPEARKSGLCYSIEDNQSLIKYLKNKIQNKQVEILQHGVCHDYDKFDRGEFASSRSSSKVSEGNIILQKVFGMEPKFFVPPGEDISRENLELVSHLGMIPVYRDTIVDKFLRFQYFPTRIRNFGFKIMMGKNYAYSQESTVQLMKPVNLYLGNNYICWSLPIQRFLNLRSSESVLELTRSLINASSALRNPICILNHYHAYFYDWNSTITKKELFKTWNSVLKSFDELPFGWKIDFSTLIDRFKRIQRVKIVQTGSKITIQSDEEVKDCSFLTSVALEEDSSGSMDKDSKIFTIPNISPKSSVVLHEKT